MLDVSDALKQIYRRNMFPMSTEKADIRGKIVFGDLGITIDNDRISKDTFRLTERISENGDLDFGSTYASVVEFTVADVPEDLNGQRFTITQTVNGTYTVPLGTFTVDSCKRQDDLRFKDIVAYDDMQKFNRNIAEWYNGLTFPITVKGMRESLCQYCGVAYESVTLVNDNVRVYKTIETNDLNGKEVLRAIAEINGTFAHINRYGNLTFISFDKSALFPSETLYPSDDLYIEDSTEILEKDGENAIAYISSKYEDYTVSAIDGIIMMDSEASDTGVTVGEATNPYVVTGNILVIGKTDVELEEIANNMLSQMQGLAYVPHETESIGLPYIEVGDTVLNANSADKELFITKRVLTGVSSVMDEFSASGNPSRENNNTVQSSEFRKLSGRTLKIIKEIDRVGVEIENLATETDTRFMTTDGAITAEVSRAQQAESSLQVSINGVRTEVSGKVGGEEVKSIVAVELGNIKLSAKQIDLNGYVKANGNFSIDEGGNWKVTGKDYEIEAANAGIYVTGKSELANYAAHYGASGVTFWHDNKIVAVLDVTDDGELQLVYYDGNEGKAGTILTSENLEIPLNDKKTKVEYTTFGNINIMKADGYIEENEENAMYGNIASVGWTRGKVETLRKEITESLEQLQNTVSENTADIETAETNISTLFDNVDTLFELVNSGGGGGEVASGAGAHNSVYRGNYLGNKVTEAQYAAIANGTFDGLFIGDYWTIGAVNYRIAAFDYYYGTGDDDIVCTEHHVTLVPDTILYLHIMNDTATTADAYVGSKMYKSGLNEAKTIIGNAFGESHILIHRQWLTNSVLNDYANGGSWYDSTVELMTEQNVYGTKIFGNSMNGTAMAYNSTVDNSQFPLFMFRHDLIGINDIWWMRDIGNRAEFTIVYKHGNASKRDASSIISGVRPSFSIIG